MGNLSASGTNGFSVEFNASDQLSFYDYTTSTVWLLRPSMRFRDTTSWYFICLLVDTEQATASDRVKIWVNGAQITDFTNEIYPSLNYDCLWPTTATRSIGRSGSLASLTHKGYLTETHFIDGQALSADDFGEINPTTDQWVPKRYTGTYGTNGFYLPFDDNASTTTLGEDASGNGNDWTLTGFTVDDSVEDTPTNNFCVLNPLNPSSLHTLSDGNLHATLASSSVGRMVRGTSFVASGKYYAEFSELVSVSISCFGAVDAVSATDGGGVPTANSCMYFANGTVYKNGVSVASYAASTVGDVIGVAVNLDDLEVSFYKNGSLLGTITGLTVADYTFGGFANQPSDKFTANFGQKPFAHTPPAGFKALSTANLDNPGDASPLTGSFTGNASADGPFVYLGYPPDTAGVCTINGNAITWGTHADALANGFKLRTSSASYNAAGSNSYSIAIDADASFADNANAQVN